MDIVSWFTHLFIRPAPPAAPAATPQPQAQAPVATVPMAPDVFQLSAAASASIVATGSMNLIGDQGAGAIGRSPFSTVVGSGGAPVVSNHGASLFEAVDLGIIGGNTAGTVDRPGA